jgi:putative heme-binding domain-containing protein
MKLHAAAPCLLVLVAFLPASAAAQESQLEEGRRLFLSQCGSCHGPQGNGGKGANLAQPQLRRATDDDALRNIIRRGIPGTEMPSSFLPPSLVESLAVYVRSLGRVEPEEIPGHPERGAETFASLDCQVCHSLGGRGGIVGPVLDDVGARRSPAYLRAALTDPDASLPRGFVQLQVATEDGRAFTAVRVNEDGFSIQLRDLSGALHSFWKDELTTLEKEFQRSPMESYQERLTPEQLDDLVAYLASLDGSS